MKNIIFKGHDNSASLKFSFADEFAEGGLNNFEDIRVSVGGEKYTLIDNPDNVIIQAPDVLLIAIGDTTKLAEGYHHVSVVGYNSIYDDGFVLVCTQVDGVGEAQVVQC